MKTDNNTTLAIEKHNEVFATQLAEAVKKSKDIAETICGLSKLENPNNATLVALLNEQVANQKFQLGYVLGLMKAYYDTLPPVVAEKQKINNIPVELLIKLKVDAEVLDNREKIKNVVDFTHETDYWARYRRLSETICGFGYNMHFIPERFKMFYPNGMHKFVSGFAEGYSNGFHTIAEESGIKTEKTNPIEQDIWKNWEYFLTHESHEYRLNGKYLFMYHGGATTRDHLDAPYGNNVKIVNENVYEALRNRAAEDFIPHNFCFNF